MYDLLSFTLICDEAALIERARQRDDNANLVFIVLEGTRTLGSTIKIDTARKPPEKVADAMLAMIKGL